jgi:outer membrane protein TolC
VFKLVEQAQHRYKAGLVTYLEVSSTETTALQAQLTQVSILNRRMTASVLLIRALGGGWRVTQVKEESLVRSDESPSLQRPTG